MRASTKARVKQLLELAYGRGRSDQLCLNAGMHPDTAKAWAPDEQEMNARRDKAVAFLLRD